MGTKTVEIALKAHWDGPCDGGCGKTRRQCLGSCPGMANTEGPEGDRR